MITYKDISWCAVNNCAKLDCYYNTRSPRFNPDKNDLVAYANRHEHCKDYKKDKSCDK